LIEVVKSVIGDVLRNKVICFAKSHTFYGFTASTEPNACAYDSWVLQRLGGEESCALRF
jgi:hypothetical protein